MILLSFLDSEFDRVMRCGADYLGEPRLLGFHVNLLKLDDLACRYLLHYGFRIFFQCLLFNLGVVFFFLRLLKLVGWDVDLRSHIEKATG